MTINQQLHNSKTHLKGIDPNCPVCGTPKTTSPKKQFRDGLVALLEDSTSSDIPDCLPGVMADKVIEYFKLH